MAGQQRRIVVGVDGSDASKRALRWAMWQAKATGSTVDAVIAWHYPSTYGWAAFGDGFDFEGDAQKLLATVISEVCGHDQDVPVRSLVAEGPAAEVLLHAARGADLLVVGSRGHGGIASTMLGSVSLHCVLHAHCPVLVLHDGNERAGGQAIIPASQYQAG